MKVIKKSLNLVSESIMLNEELDMSLSGYQWFLITCMYRMASFKIADEASKILSVLRVLTHRGRVTHICVSKLTIIGSDNGLAPGRRQAIIWTNAGILLIRTLGTNFSELLSKIHAFSFKKMHLKMSSAKWRPFCLGLNVLTYGLASIPDSHYITVWMMVKIYHAISFQWSQYSVSLPQIGFSQMDKRL